ncbi:MAG: transposase [Candidatus Brocadiia bacterium]
MAKRYSPKLKFQVVKELLESAKSVAQIARAYGVHPNTVRNWEETFKKNGAEIFQKDGTIAEYEKKVSQLERLLGKKEVEIALLSGFR